MKIALYRIKNSKAGLISGLSVTIIKKILLFFYSCVLFILFWYNFAQSRKKYTWTVFPEGKATFVRGGSIAQWDTCQVKIVLSMTI